MRNQAKQTQGRGSALVWILVWLVGVISIAWAGINYALPRFEAKLQTAVQESISAFNADPVYVSTRGSAVTISGEIDDPASAQAVIAAANETIGVGTVFNELVIIEASSNNATPIPTDAPLLSENADDPASDVQTESTDAPVTAKILSGVELAEIAEQEATTASSTIAALTDQNSSSLNQPSDSLNNEQLAMLDATVTQRSTKNKPSLNIRVFDNILTIDGSMASSDDTSKLIQDALNSFDRDIVTNGITQQDDIANAEWLAALQQIMPLMQPLDAAQIGIAEQQMTLAGIAPNRAVHDAVINEALASMGDFSLIEKITVSGSQSSDVNTPMVLTAAVQAQQAEVPSKDSAEQLAQAEAERLAKIEAEKQARLKAEAAARAKAEAAAKAKAEELALQQAQAAARAKAEEQERLRVEAEQKAKAAEQARLKAAAEQKARKEEQARLQAEAEQKAKEEEQARLQAEADKKAQEAEQAKLLAEAEQKAKEAEQARLQAEAAQKAKEEEARLQAEAEREAKQEEQARIAAEAAAAEAEAARAKEEAILLAQAKTEAEEQERLIAEARKKADAAARQKAEETAQIQAEAEAAAKAAEEIRLKAEVEARLKADAAAKARRDARLAAEAAEKADGEEKRREEAERIAEATEQARLQAEAEAQSEGQNNDSVDENDNEALQDALAKLPTLRILFESQGNKLTKDSLNVLNQVADILKQHPQSQLMIEGHTDATGDPDQNLDLSLLRATTVRDYLTSRGVSPSNLRAIGYGEAVPLVPNNTPEGRAINRRIEFTFR